MPLTGFLKVSGTQSRADEEARVVPGTLPFTVSESKVFPTIVGLSPLSWVIGLPLVLALLLVFVVSAFDVILNTLRRDKTKVRLGSTLGTGLTPSLKFGEGGSWASLTAVVAAIFTAFTAAAVYPEERPYFSKEEMAGFILFFGVLVGFAPVVYNLARRPEPVVTKEGPGPIAEEAQVQGFVWTALGASTLILAALLGQLLVAGVLTLQLGSAMAPEGKWLLRAILVISALYAALYVYRGLRLTLNRKSKKKHQLAETLEEAKEKDQLSGLLQPLERYKTRERMMTML
jgi:hypothetical protein